MTSIRSVKPIHTLITSSTSSIISMGQSYQSQSKSRLHSLNTAVLVTDKTPLSSSIKTPHCYHPRKNSSATNSANNYANSDATNCTPNSVLSYAYSSSLTRSHHQSGFTLVEIMVVVVVLSIFAGMMSLSVGSSESRKNLAFYEHLVDSLQYVRLLSAERMQPMGLALKANKQGQLSPVIVSLSDPYHSYQQSASASDNGKNAMELTAMSADKQNTQPSWQVDPSVTLPAIPDKVTITINALDGQGGGGMSVPRQLQPWFVGQDVPQVMWFGTGEATPVTIEIDHEARPVGEVIIIQPNGRVQVGQAK